MTTGTKERYGMQPLVSQSSRVCVHRYVVCGGYSCLKPTLTLAPKGNGWHAVARASAPHPTPLPPPLHGCLTPKPVHAPLHRACDSEAIFSQHRISNPCGCCLLFVVWYAHTKVSSQSSRVCVHRSVVCRAHCFINPNERWRPNARQAKHVP